MSHYQKATVTEISETTITLSLDNNQTIQWPKKNTEHLEPLQTGDELILTLTSGINVIQDLLGLDQSELSQ